MSNPHPTDAPEFAGQRALYRTATLVVVGALLIVSLGFGMVVTFTLGGVPLVGNRFQVAGVPLPTLAAFLLTPIVIAVAILVGRARLAGAVARMRFDHPELAESEKERLFGAVAAGLFTTQAILVGFGFALAVLFHLTASFGVVACIGLIELALLAGYPTSAKVRADYDRAARLRGARH